MGLYYCLRILWQTLIANLSLAKALSHDIQFIAHSILPLVHAGVACDYVLKQWSMCLTMLFLQNVTLSEDICNAEHIPNIASTIAQFIKFLRIFDDEYNVDVVPSILMLQQYKRMLIEINDWNKEENAELKSVDQLKKEHPNLSSYMICQFVMAWVHRLQNGKAMNSLIGMSVEEFITNAFIKNNFKSLFDFKKTDDRNIASHRIDVDIMTMTDEQFNLLHMISSKMNSEHPYFSEVHKIFSKTTKVFT